MIPWGMFRHDSWRTGYFNSQIQQVSLVVDKYNKTSPRLIFTLEQNFPNPFRDKTYISYVIPTKSFVSLSFYDVSGRKVKEIKCFQDPGIYRIVWDGEDNQNRPLSAGVYFYRLKAGNRVLTRKLLFLH